MSSCESVFCSPGPLAYYCPRSNYNNLGRGQGRGGRGRGSGFAQQQANLPFSDTVSPRAARGGRAGQATPQTNGSSSKGSLALAMKLIKGGFDGFTNFSALTCEKFVSGLFEAPDHRVLLSQIDPSGSMKDQNEKLIRRVLTENEGVEFLRKVVLPFFEWLGKTELSTGTCQPMRDRVINAAADAPGLLAGIARDFHTLSSAGNLKSLSWFLEVIVRLDVRKWSTSPPIQRLHLQMSQCPDPLVSSVGTRLCDMITALNTPARLQPRVIGANLTPTLEEMQALTPGGRHDNDFADYRAIEIVPTVDEMKSTADPFLPMPTDRWPMADRLFRLMRQDMISSMRENMSKIPPAKPVKKSKGSESTTPAPEKPALPTLSRGYVIESLGGIEFDRFNSWFLKISFKLPDTHPTAGKKQKEKENYWQVGRGKKALTRGTIVCVSPIDRLDQPILIGEVASRTPADLASLNPWIGARFVGQALQAAIGVCKSPPSGLLALIPINTALFMYGPILNRLKSMAEVPFPEELDDQRKRIPQRSPLAQHFGQEYHEMNVGNPPVVQGLEGTLDPGQLEGAKMALMQRVTLIQGPPGTGKTYIGTYITSLMVKKKLKVLCVTYTNHAVDDFCEGLLKCGVKNICRLGSGSKNDAIAPITLAYLKDSSKGKVGSNSIFNFRWRQALNDLDARKEEARNLASISAGNIKNIRQRWDEISAFLEDEGNAWVLELTLARAPEDGGFERAEKKGRRSKLTADFLWKKWLDGKPLPADVAPAELVSNELSCWSFSKERRNGLATSWASRIDSEDINSLTTALKTVDDALSVKESLSRELEYAILSSMDVILCTTTAAAKQSDLIKAAACDVVLVEEAGEILETHVLSSIYENAKTLIMIGDHLQLRPKVLLFVAPLVFPILPHSVSRSRATP